MFDRFRLAELGTDVPTELRAGLATFLTMSYILAVNPSILAEAGMPAEEVAFATAVAAAIACLVMGLLANLPFALAPGMGLNAYFTYGVVLGLGVDWRVALAAVFVEGLIFLALSITGVRTALVRALPEPIKLATTAGIGLFLAMIGLQGAGLVVDHPATLVSLGELGSIGVVLALAGIVLIAGLMARGVRGSILIGIVVVAVGSWISGVAPMPESLIQMPSLPKETLLAFDLSQLLSAKMALAVIAFLFVDIFDTAGTLIGVGRLAGLTDEHGELPNMDRAFVADAVGTTIGAMLGTSTVTSYVESATGVQEGGRSGLTAVTVGVLFLFALPFTPLLIAIPALATAPALVVVGSLMMRGATDIDWADPAVAVPAFLTIVSMPFTYSIATGIALGLISWVLVQSLVGRAREVPPLLWLMAILLAAFFGLR